jgi:hypothetical protein
MENEPTPNGLTRRSFIKRSVVAAVAVSSLTIFSGLVNAQIESYPTPITSICSLSTNVTKKTCCTKNAKGVTECTYKNPANGQETVDYCITSTQQPIRKDGKAATGCGEDGPTY